MSEIIAWKQQNKGNDEPAQFFFMKSNWKYQAFPQSKQDAQGQKAGQYPKRQALRRILRAGDKKLCVMKNSNHSPLSIIAPPLFLNLPIRKVGVKELGLTGAGTGK